MTENVVSDEAMHMLHTIGGLVVSMRDALMADSFKTEVGVPKELPADQELGFYTGMDCALDLVITLIMGIEDHGGLLDQESLNRVLDDLSG